jgi:glutamate racemase
MKTPNFSSTPSPESDSSLVSMAAAPAKETPFDPSDRVRQSLQTARIGVFDSGVGGLTVLRELYRQLPNESILYFGDTARLPYGMRSPAEILQFVREIITWMQQEGVKMVIMACNTSSALALDRVRSEFDVPILGVILPGARAAVQQGRQIGVIATPATAASNAYKQAIAEIDPTAQVWQVGCPEFVPLIEHNRLTDPYTRSVAIDYLTPLLEKQIDTLIYGCTHYPHLEPILKTILPPQVRLVDPAVHVVKAAAQELDLLGLKNPYPPLPTQFYVSGHPDPFIHISKQWLGCTPVVHQIDVAKLAMIASPTTYSSIA